MLELLKQDPAIQTLRQDVFDLGGWKVPGSSDVGDLVNRLSVL